MRDYYKILLVGSSGKGKTYSFRNMDPNTTGFVNVEDKPLPFKNKFKYHTRALTLDDAKAAIKSYAENKEINCIVIDSLSAYMDLLIKLARATKKNFDIWNMYNEELGKFFSFIKSIQKEVFITGHYEWIQDEGGAKERRFKSKGKEWESVVEKEFTIVLYTESKWDDKAPKYYFSIAGPDCSGKCPPDIFGEGIYQVDSDSKLVLDKILEFVNN